MKHFFAAHQSRFLNHLVTRKLNLAPGLYSLELKSKESINDRAKCLIAIHCKGFAIHTTLFALRLQEHGIDFKVVCDHRARRWLILLHENPEALKRTLSQAIAAPAEQMFFANRGWFLSNSTASVPSKVFKKGQRRKILLASAIGLAFLALIFAGLVNQAAPQPDGPAETPSPTAVESKARECRDLSELARSLQGLLVSSLDDQGVAALAYLPDNILERVSGVETIGGESVLFATSSCLLTQPPTQTAVQISLSSSKNGWQIRNVIPVKNDPLE